MTEEIIVFFIVFCAVLYAAIKTYKSLHNCTKDKKGGCANCPLSDACKRDGASKGKQPQK